MKRVVIQLLLMTAGLAGYNYRHGLDNRKTEPICDIIKN